jgi:hypothetical protein
MLFSTLVGLSSAFSQAILTSSQAEKIGTGRVATTEKADWSQVALWWTYLHGVGMAQGPVDFLKWLADIKSAEAQTTLGIAYCYGNGVAQDYNKEVPCFRMASGIETPDISVLSDDFLKEIKATKQKNLAVEALRRLLAGKFKPRTRNKVVDKREFSELLEAVMTRYYNRRVVWWKFDGRLANMWVFV